jgi:hypothetical protein
MADKNVYPTGHTVGCFPRVVRNAGWPFARPYFALMLLTCLRPHARIPAVMPWSSSRERAVMRKCCPLLVSLLVALTAAHALAQSPDSYPNPRAGDNNAVPVDLRPAPISTQIDAPPMPDEFTIRRLPLVDAAPLEPPYQDPSPVVGEMSITNAPISLDGLDDAPPARTLSDFVGYRYTAGSLDWIPGNGNQFGIFSIVSDHYQKSGITNGLGIGLGFHFLSGPDQTDMPAIVYDFSLAYQIRQRIGPLAFDLSTSVLAASDFKGCARKGILFPSHAVGYLTVGPTIDLVFGVDYLDRGDVKLLPVAGMVWNPTPLMRFEIVFPRPRAVFQLNDHYRLYVSGELGGGTWAIERASLEDDLATYHDLRVCVGIESVEKDGRCSAIEIGYLFDRRLEYTSGIGDMNLDDAVLLRLVTTY